MEEQIEEEQKTNLIEVVLGENGSLGQIIQGILKW